jgi:diadenosine tetraphosphatase ApaH/serine/threonine PP2A family protein phosphatase
MIAIISDIHSNLEALESVLEDIRAREIGKIYCLGDVVGYGPDPEACIDRLLHLEVVTMGNHDEAVLTRNTNDFNFRARRAAEWTRDRLNTDIAGDPKKMERWNFLERMKTIHDEGDVTYLHASPRSPTREYVLPADIAHPDKMKDIFGRFSGICFAGHTHIPGVFTEAGEYLPPADLNGVYLLDGRKAFINVGSVGQPRDRDPRACYVTFNGDTVVFRRIPYDVDKTCQKIHKIDALDRYLGDRLKLGR